jgi:hypothetical protein
VHALSWVEIFEPAVYRFLLKPFFYHNNFFITACPAVILQILIATWRRQELPCLSRWPSFANWVGFTLPQLAQIDLSSVDVPLNTKQTHSWWVRHCIVCIKQTLDCAFTWLNYHIHLSVKSSNCKHCHSLDYLTIRVNKKLLIQLANVHCRSYSQKSSNFDSK